jgi:hypothetical protein
MPRTVRSRSNVPRRSTAHATPGPSLFGAAGLVALGVVLVAFLYQFGPLRSRTAQPPSAVEQPAPLIRVGITSAVRPAVPSAAPTEHCEKVPRPRQEPDEPPSRPVSRPERDLRVLLQKACRTLDLETEKGTGRALLAQSTQIEQVVARRADLEGLPVLLGGACRMSKAQATVLSTVSERFRELKKKESDCIGLLEKETHDRGEAQARLLVRPFEQLYQTERPFLRIELVRSLARIEGKEATQALVRRAVFDLSQWVRSAATEALKDRRLRDARPVLLAALRHPWPPVADHAALALVELKDEGAVPELRELLKQPSPTAPHQGKDGKWVEKELVRVNHLRNCLLCHPPEVGPAGVVRGPIPTPGRPLLPEEKYYGGQERETPGPFVLATIVYIRQDFSVMHEVANPDRWQAIQRYDYLVREREVRNYRGSSPVPSRPDNAQPTYPQREAVRYALARLESSER